MYTISRLSAIFIFAASISFFDSGCKKEQSQISTSILRPPGAKSTSTVTAERATTRDVCFTAIAAINGCIGENIVFGGTLEYKENTTIDQNGTVHFTRHWGLKGTTGKGVVPGGSINTAAAGCPKPYTGNYTGNNYEVIAGAEMFSVKDPNTTTGAPSAVLSGDVYIHEGTVVFVNTVTGERIVARHQIIKNPGQGIVRSGWYIKGQECL